MLKILVSHAGSPVSKGDLFASVWPDVAVTDDALTTCIQELRRVLSDDAKHPQFIETRHRRGYQFIAAVSREARPGAGARRRGRAGAISSIAVLPFADMSPSHDQEYLCEGLAEELINALTQVDGLRVAARTASFQFRGKGEDVRIVGEQLNVEALLEGSVRKSDDRLRVTVQLIEVASGYHRWSHRFDGQFEDVFAMQDEIAESVATSLRGGAVSPREKRPLHRAPTGDERPTSCTCADASTSRGSGIPIWCRPPICSAGPSSSTPDMVRPTPASRRRMRRCTSGSAPTTRTSPEPSAPVNARSNWRRISRRPTSRADARCPS